MLHIDTDAEPIDIVKAIDTVTSTIGRMAQEKNQFAESMMVVDLDVAEATLLEAGRELEAAQTLINFAHDMIGDDQDLPADEYEV